MNLYTTGTIDHYIERIQKITIKIDLDDYI